MNVGKLQCHLGCVWHHLFNFHAILQKNVIPFEESKELCIQCQRSM